MSAPHALAGTELHVLPRSANGRQYQLHVAVPPSVAAGRGGRVPVVYLTDPYWDFPLVYATLGNLAYDQAAPECLLVGVGYPGEGLDWEAMRVHDLAPVPDALHPPSAGEEGGAERFLRAIEHEVLPFVEGRWPVDPARRVIAGSSLGGLFALFATFTRPGLFPGVVAVSPAVIWADEWLLGLEERFHAGGGDLDARLFLSGAAEEWPAFLASVVRLEARLRGRYPGLDYQWRLIDGERHSGTKAEGFTRGLRWVFGGR